jgi:uncharacterized membrane-anchored protein
MVLPAEAVEALGDGMSVSIEKDYPFRQQILDEVHARPVEMVPARSRVRRLVFVVGSETGGVAATLKRFCDWCEQSGFVPPRNKDLRQHSFTAGTRQVTWEFHTEFVTITWTAAPDDSVGAPAGIGLESIDGPQLLGAMRIDLVDDTGLPESLLPGFNPHSLCVIGVEGGTGQLATDFVPDADRFTRFEFAAGGLQPLRRAILVRRILEIETYRTMALIGLPLARQHANELGALESELTEKVNSLTEATDTSRAQTALEALHGLMVRAGRLSERLTYRFAACQAYGDILQARLGAIGERPTPLGSSLSRYILNRVDPALRTYAAMEKRLDVLFAKIERAIELLNVRIGLDVQTQNKQLLATIAETGRSQLLLQRTVEGLSTIAISYYTIGILGYVVATPLEMLAIDKSLVLSIAAPFILLGVWLMVRAIRKRHFPD